MVSNPGSYVSILKATCYSTGKVDESERAAARFSQHL